MKVMNPEWHKIEVAPIDFALREQVGVSLDVENLINAGEVVDTLIRDTPLYYEKIGQLKEKTFYHPGHSGEVSGQYILDRLQEKQKRKMAKDN